MDLLCARDTIEALPGQHPAAHVAELTPWLWKQYFAAIQLRSAPARSLDTFRMLDKRRARLGA